MATYSSGSCALISKKRAAIEVDFESSGVAKDHRTAPHSAVDARTRILAPLLIREFGSLLWAHAQRTGSWKQTFTGYVFVFPVNLVEGCLEIRLQHQDAVSVPLTPIESMGRRLRYADPGALFQQLGKADLLSVWYRQVIKTLGSPSDRPVSETVLLHRMLGHLSLYFQMRVYGYFHVFELETRFADTRHQFGVGRGEQQGAHHALLPRVHDNLKFALKKPCESLWRYVRQDIPKETLLEKAPEEIQRLLFLLILRKVNLSFLEVALQKPFDLFFEWIQEKLSDHTLSNEIHLIPCGSSLYVLSNAVLVANASVNRADSLIEMVTRSLAMEGLSKVAQGRLDPTAAFNQFDATFDMRLEQLLVSLSQLETVAQQAIQTFDELLVKLQDSHASDLAAKIDEVKITCEAALKAFPWFWEELHEKNKLRELFLQWHFALKEVRGALNVSGAVQDHVVFSIDQSISQLQITLDKSDSRHEREIISDSLIRHMGERDKRLSKRALLQASLAQNMHELDRKKLCIDFPSSSGDVQKISIERARAYVLSWERDIEQAQKRILYHEKTLEELVVKEQKQVQILQEIEKLQAEKARHIERLQVRSLSQSLVALKPSFSQRQKDFTDEMGLLSLYIELQKEAGSSLKEVMERCLPYETSQVSQTEDWMSGIAAGMIASVFLFTHEVESAAAMAEAEAASGRPLDGVAPAVLSIRGVGADMKSAPTPSSLPVSDSARV